MKLRAPPLSLPVPELVGKQQVCDASAARPNINRDCWTNEVTNEVTTSEPQATTPVPFVGAARRSAMFQVRVALRDDKKLSEIQQNFEVLWRVWKLLCTCADRGSHCVTDRVLEVWLRKKYQPLSLPFTWQRSGWLSMPSRRRNIRSLNFRMQGRVTSQKRVNCHWNNSQICLFSPMSILWRILYFTLSWFLSSLRFRLCWAFTTCQTLTSLQAKWDELWRPTNKEVKMALSGSFGKAPLHIILKNGELVVGKLEKAPLLTCQHQSFCTS